LGFSQQLSSRHAKEGKALLEESQALDERELSSAPENPRCLYSLAADQAVFGNSQAAITALNKAIKAGWIDYRSMELDPRFDSIRITEAFKEILIRLTNKVEEMRRQLLGRQLASNDN
jgi:hypothetical protein